MEKTILELLREKGIPATDPTNTMIADTVASSAPAILALLGGADTTSVNRQFAKGNQYLSTRGDQEAEALKNMKQIDVNGMPVNVKPVDALYQQDYEKKKLSEALSGRGYALKQLKNKKTGETVFAQQVGGKLLNMNDGQIIENPSDYMIYEKDYRKSFEDIQGNQGILQLDPVTGKQKTIPIAQGVGSYADVGTKEEGEAILKEKARLESEALAAQQQLKGFEVAGNLLNKSNDPRAINTAIFTIAKDVNKGGGVMSDPDFERIIGMNSQTFLQRVQNAVNKNITGELQEYANSFKALVSFVKKKKQSELNAINESFNRGGTRSKVTAPGAAKPSRANQAEYEKIRRKVQERIKAGGNAQKLNQFLNDKKVELGIM